MGFLKPKPGKQPYNSLVPLSLPSVIFIFLARAITPGRLILANPPRLTAIPASCKGYAGLHKPLAYVYFLFLYCSQILVL